MDRHPESELTPDEARSFEALANMLDPQFEESFRREEREIIESSKDAEDWLRANRHRWNGD